MSQGRWMNSRVRAIGVKELVKPYGFNGIKRNDLVKLVMEKNTCTYRMANQAVNRALANYPRALVLRNDYGVVTYHAEEDRE